MTPVRASLFAAAEIFGAIVVDTVEAAIDLFVLLRLLRAPAKPAPVILRAERLLPAQEA